MASLPTYDPSVFTDGISQKGVRGADRPQLRRSAYFAGVSEHRCSRLDVQACLALGCSVASGQANLNGTYPARPAIDIGGQSFHNFEGESGGDISLHQAIVISCDVIFDQFAYNAWLADGGLRTGKGPMPRRRSTSPTWPRPIGFGRDTGIDLPDESSGWVTDRASALKIWTKR